MAYATAVHKCAGIGFCPPGKPQQSRRLILSLYDSHDVYPRAITKADGADPYPIVLMLSELFVLQTTPKLYTMPP